MPPPSFAKPAAAAAPAHAATKPAAAPTPAPAAAAPAPAPAATAPVAPGQRKPRVSKYGDVAGEIPAVAGVDLKATFDAVTAALDGVDLDAFVDAFDKMPSTDFPGRKEGRAAYTFGNVLCRLAQIRDMYAAKPVRSRDSGKKKAMQVMAKRLLSALGGSEVPAEITDALSKFGINLADLQAE